MMAMSGGNQSSAQITETPTTLTTAHRAWQLTRRVFGRPEFNKYNTAYGDNGRMTGVCASIPPELVELIHRSLDIEPELWETDGRAPYCNGVYNRELNTNIRFDGGAHRLSITQGEYKFGRVENWTAGLPGTWRHKLVQRIKNAHARTHKAYLYEQLGWEQAKLELRNAGKTTPHLPKRVTDPGMVQAPSQGLLAVGGQGGQIMGRASRQKLMADHSADALSYAAQSQSAREALEKQAQGAKKLQQIADHFGVVADYAETLFGQVAHQTMKAPKT